ncbi:glycosyltransferase family 2 protein [Candidatus Uhrbacteria bacterium]|nr:glycosyltransferase family 2 protein [Candidatus Uhrbacteria bacterium]
MSDISVIIPTYQHAKTISACIESLLFQTKPPKEIIVVDDGSTDDTKIRLKRFGNSIVYLFQENQGAPSARNLGAQLSTGSFLLFCDADVIVKPSMLEKMEQTLQNHSEAAYVYCGFNWNCKLFNSRLFDPEILKKNNYIHTTSLIRKSLFPGFDPSIKRLQDWDLWLTMLELSHHGIAIDEILFDVQNVRGRKNISFWLPSFFYKIPWQKIGWIPKPIRDYRAAEKVIKNKHHLKFENHT